MIEPVEKKHLRENALVDLKNWLEIFVGTVDCESRVIQLVHISEIVKIFLERFPRHFPFEIDVIFALLERVNFAGKLPMRKEMWGKLKRTI